MRILYRIALLVFGLFSSILGLISIIVSLITMIFSCSDITDPAERIFMAIWIFVLGELFLAFGISASLVGLRCVCGPKNWIVKTIDYTWSKAVKIAMILPFFGFGLAAIAWVVKFIIS